VVTKAVYRTQQIDGLEEIRLPLAVGPVEDVEPSMGFDVDGLQVAESSTSEGIE
jgi:hypothetical protein